MKTLASLLITIAVIAVIADAQQTNLFAPPALSETQRVKERLDDHLRETRDRELRSLATAAEILYLSADPQGTINLYGDQGVALLELSERKAAYLAAEFTRFGDADGLARLAEIAAIRWSYVKHENGSVTLIPPGWTYEDGQLVEPTPTPTPIPTPTPTPEPTATPTSTPE